MTDERENMKRCMRCAYASGNPVLCDGVKLRVRARSGECPHPLGSRFVLPIIEAERSVPRSRTRSTAVPRRPMLLPPVDLAELEQRRLDNFRRKWSSLHHYAISYGGDAEAAKDWMSKFAAELPCGECRQHWRALLEEMPPDYTSSKAFWEWTVAAHNAVNRLLGKPELSNEQALAIWVQS